MTIKELKSVLDETTPVIVNEYPDVWDDGTMVFDGCFVDFIHENLYNENRDIYYMTTNAYGQLVIEFLEVVE